MNYFLSIVILVSGICFGQNKYYVLPENQSFNLYEKQEDELVKLEELKFKYTELYAFDADELVIVNDDSTKFHYGRIKNSRFEEELVKEFPEKFKINTIELKDGYVYLGGNWSDGELFYVFDIKSKEFHAVPIPDEAYLPGKAIDDILFFEDKIIAVDNIVQPKYLIFYEDKDLPQLQNGDVFKLSHNGPYEHIYKGDINEKYLVLLSGTLSGWVGSYDHITVLTSNNLDFKFSISTKSTWNEIVWKDILLVKDRIFIAQENNVLGVLLIKENYFNKSKRNDTSISLDKIKLHQELDNQPIKLLPFSEQKIIVILENAQGQKSFERIKI